jgi:hypothetical protein
MFDIAVGGDKKGEMMESKSQSVSSTEVLSFSARNITSGNALTEGNLALAITAHTETFDIAESRGPEALDYSPMVSMSSNPADSKTRRDLPNFDPNETFEPQPFSGIPHDQYKPYDRAVYNADLRVQLAHVICEFRCACHVYWGASDSQYLYN